MAKIKVAELAKELNLDPKELLKNLQEKGYSVKTIASSVNEEEAQKIRELYNVRSNFIIIKKEELETHQADLSESAFAEILGPEVLEKPKKKKLVIKKAKKEEPEVEKPEALVTPEKEVLEKESIKFEEVIKEEKPLEEPEKEVKVLPEKRVVTDFRPRKERPFKPREAPSAPIPTEEPETIPRPEKEEIKRKKKEKELELKEKKKGKKKPGIFKKERRELEAFEELFLEEPEVLFEEKEELVEEKPKKIRGKVERVPERPPTLPPKERKIRVYETIQVSELAKLMGVKIGELIKKSLQMGMPITANQSIDADTAAILADEFSYQVEKAPIEEEILLQYTPPSSEELKPRPPVVTVMGHVDHGKTTLLDAIRKTDVASKEAGGITQHIGAYTVKLEDGRIITFIDTPGHEAFTSMRARGAQVTDIVILVVAADDGVMEQTKEAIEHARAAKVPIVVAINKIDKPDANPERVKSQLAELGLVPEEWGGDTLVANISAKKRIGIEELLELVLLQAEMLELRASYNRPARGRIIESRLDKGRGPIATVIIQEGTLKDGDIFVAGLTYGRVRAMFDSYGNRIRVATPSIPVEILGVEDVPQAGDDFIVVDEEEKARKIAEYRQRKAREAEAAKEVKVSLEKLFEKLKEGEIKELNMVLKADTQGTLEALKSSLSKLSTDKVKINIIRAGIGAISESDVMLASASNAIVVGFNVKPTSNAKNVAKEERVEIKFYEVIYQLIDDIKKAMTGLLEPKFEEHITGIAEVRATFRIPKIGIVAGCYVKEGTINRNNKVRVIRDGVVIFTGNIASLKRFKEDVRDVSAGYECGLRIENFQDIKEGDIIEAFEIKEVSPEL
jgi:translation initiation factor IF-2